MSRRAVTLLIAGIGLAGALLVAAIVPAPFIALTPGPTLNTLGPLNGKPIITITGRPTYPTSGHLNMVTVESLGGPGAQFSIFAALQAWLNPHDAVVPTWVYFPPGQTRQQVIQQDNEQMAGSEQTATAAALCQLGIPFTVKDTVTATIRSSGGVRLPAYGVLQVGDTIVAVNGTRISCRADAATLLGADQPGKPAVLTVLRHGTIRKISVTTADVGGQPIIGVDLTESYTFPITVKINIGDIGGPSAGTMFALAIIDKLTHDNLAGGRFIAGTGTISANGQIGEIGGIQQKLVAARAAGATVFLTPASNCPDTVGAVPAGLRLIKVSTLNAAVAALSALRAGQPVPTC